MYIPLLLKDSCEIFLKVKFLKQRYFMSIILIILTRSSCLDVVLRDIGGVVELAVPG